MLSKGSTVDILQTIEANFVDYSLAFVRAVDGHVHETPELTWVECPFQLGYYNGVMRTTLPEDADITAIVRERPAYFQARKQRMLWWVTPFSRPETLERTLQEQGLTFLWSDVAMAIDLTQIHEDQPWATGLTIAPVADEEELRTWAATMIAGFEMPSPYAEEYTRMILSAELARHHLGPFYLARLHGKPVGTSALFVSAGVAGINEVGVVPAARGKGIGAQVTLAALRAGRERGLQQGVLGASAMGEPVYRRLGFAAYGTFDAYSHAWRPTS